MLLVFTSDELERLAEKFSGKKLEIEFLGTNQFKVKASNVSVKIFLEEVQPRRLTFSYKMNAVVNFFAERFVNLDKPGIIWDKQSDKFHLDFDQMPQDEKTKDFYIKQMIIDDQKMIIDFDLYQHLERHT
jgi:hypothetical protein